MNTLTQTFLVFFLCVSYVFPLFFPMFSLVVDGSYLFPGVGSIIAVQDLARLKEAARAYVKLSKLSSPEARGT